jgi:protocatechuate 3,4-dioxygenase alpha subunit
MKKLRDTPSQTVGPFFAYGLTAEQYSYDFTSIADGLLVSQDSDHVKIAITGCVYDGNGNVIPDAMIELWQGDSLGKYNDQSIGKDREDFRGFGRLGTGTQRGHKFYFTTIKPGSVEKGCAPHINVILFMRGSLLHLYTRIYFDDEAEANKKDPLLNLIPEARRQTLIAKRVETGGVVQYNFDIHMQGDRETVFFDVKN